MKYALLLLLSSISAFAQFSPLSHISVGVKGGLPINGAFETAPGSGYSFSTKRYILGASIEVGLPKNFAFEVDGLYRRLGYDFGLPPTIQPGTGLTQLTPSHNNAFNQWEFPVLIKWYALDGHWRPFLSAGGAFRYLTGSASELHAKNSIGAVFGGGVAFKVHRFSVAPELRYTRWGREAFRSPNGSDGLRSNRDQADFLLGVNF